MAALNELNIAALARQFLQGRDDFDDETIAPAHIGPVINHTSVITQSMSGSSNNETQRLAEVTAALAAAQAAASAHAIREAEDKAAAVAAAAAAALVEETNRREAAEAAEKKQQKADEAQRVAREAAETKQKADEAQRVEAEAAERKQKADEAQRLETQAAERKQKADEAQRLEREAADKKQKKAERKQKADRRAERAKAKAQRVERDAARRAEQEISDAVEALRQQKEATDKATATAAAAAEEANRKAAAAAAAEEANRKAQEVATAAAQKQTAEADRKLKEKADYERFAQKANGQKKHGANGQVASSSANAVFTSSHVIELPSSISQSPEVATTVRNLAAREVKKEDKLPSVAPVATGPRAHYKMRSWQFMEKPETVVQYLTDSESENTGWTQVVPYYWPQRWVQDLEDVVFLPSHVVVHPDGTILDMVLRRHDELQSVRVTAVRHLNNEGQVGILRLVQAHEGPPFRKDDAFITTPERAFQEWLQALVQVCDIQVDIEKCSLLAIVAQIKHKWTCYYYNKKTLGLVNSPYESTPLVPRTPLCLAVHLSEKDLLSSATGINNITTSPESISSNQCVWIPSSAVTPTSISDQFLLTLDNNKNLTAADASNHFSKNGPILLYVFTTEHLVGFAKVMKVICHGKSSKFQLLCEIAINMHKSFRTLHQFMFAELYLRNLRKDARHKEHPLIITPFHKNDVEGDMSTDTRIVSLTTNSATADTEIKSSKACSATPALYSLSIEDALLLQTLVAACTMRIRAKLCWRDLMEKQTTFSISSELGEFPWVFERQGYSIGALVTRHEACLAQLQMNIQLVSDGSTTVATVAPPVATLNNQARCMAEFQKSASESVLDAEVTKALKKQLGIRAAAGHTSYWHCEIRICAGQAEISECDRLYFTKRQATKSEKKEDAEDKNYSIAVFTKYMEEFKQKRDIQHILTFLVPLCDAREHVMVSDRWCDLHPTLNFAKFTAKMQKVQATIASIVEEFGNGSSVLKAAQISTRRRKPRKGRKTRGGAAASSDDNDDNDPPSTSSTDDDSEDDDHHHHNSKLHMDIRNQAHLLQSFQQEMHESKKQTDQRWDQIQNLLEKLAGKRGADDSKVAIAVDSIAATTATTPSLSLLPISPPSPANNAAAARKRSRSTSRSRDNDYLKRNKPTPNPVASHHGVTLTHQSPRDRDRHRRNDAYVPSTAVSRGGSRYDRKEQVAAAEAVPRHEQRHRTYPKRNWYRSQQHRDVRDTPRSYSPPRPASFYNSDRHTDPAASTYRPYDNTTDSDKKNMYGSTSSSMSSSSGHERHRSPSPRPRNSEHEETRKIVSILRPREAGDAADPLLQRKNTVTWGGVCSLSSKSDKPLQKL